VAASVLMTCHQCGNQTVSICDVLLTVYVNARNLSYVAAGCPTCGGQIRKTVDEATQALLRSAGARVDLTRVDSELFDPARQITAPLQLDDLLDLHLALEAL